MPKFTPKPSVQLEARQWDGTYAQAVDLIKWVQAGGMVAYYENNDQPYIVINTTQGPLYTSPHDWVVKGPLGRFYPQGSDVIAAAYDQTGT